MNRPGVLGRKKGQLRMSCRTYKRVKSAKAYPVPRSGKDGKREINQTA